MSNDRPADSYNCHMSLPISLYSTLAALIDRLESDAMDKSDVIDWGSPVPSFGDPTHALVATLGLNPSNREFVDNKGDELQCQLRRLHTLNSLGISAWSEADVRHLTLVLDTCRSYFSTNPYSTWFKRLDYVISGLNVSYYHSPSTACHFDLVPFATRRKWSELPTYQQSLLLDLAQDSLGVIVRDSPIQILILNGSTVVKRFESVAGCSLDAEVKHSWSLNRRSKRNIPGVAFTGSIDRLAGIYLDRRVKVMGFNHNLQGSFGVSREIIDAIRDWVAQNAGRE